MCTIQLDQEHHDCIASQYHEKTANNALQLTTNPRHGSCVRTCRATGSLQLRADVRQRRL